MVCHDNSRRRQISNNIVFSSLFIPITIFCFCLNQNIDHVYFILFMYFVYVIFICYWDEHHWWCGQGHLRVYSLKCLRDVHLLLGCIRRSSVLKLMLNIQELIPLRKVWIELFSLQLWTNSRADWLCNLVMATGLGEGKLCIQTF